VTVATAWEDCTQRVTKLIRRYACIAGSVNQTARIIKIEASRSIWRHSLDLHSNNSRRSAAAFQFLLQTIRTDRETSYGGIDWPLFPVVVIYCAPQIIPFPHHPVPVPHAKISPSIAAPTFPATRVRPQVICGSRRQAVLSCTTHPNLLVSSADNSVARSSSRTQTSSDISRLGGGFRFRPGQVYCLLSPYPASDRLRPRRRDASDPIVSRDHLRRSGNGRVSWMRSTTLRRERDCCRQLLASIVRRHPRSSSFGRRPHHSFMNSILTYRNKC